VKNSQGYQQMLRHYQEQPLDSAIPQKGLLAVAAACAGSPAVPVVEQYLRKWYGYRAAQCRALLQVLSWIDNPSAIQLLLATAKRFRTASIRQEAENLVRDLAERRNWTVEELADRSIPTAGLSPGGELTLDYGERQFTARLNDDLDITLVDPEGKNLASLPTPRKSEDTDRVKQAKKQFTDAKKELKAIIKQQQDRLYEALCTQRTWSFADWDTYLCRHPIVGRLCQRLVWTVYDGERLTTTFRLLEDGTLTGPEDEEVKVKAGATVRLAHACTVPADTGVHWLRHFADYKVFPLFEEFGKPVLELTDTLRGQISLDEFTGHMIEAFKLRGRATKLGYQRGPTGDGGYFSEYHKQFPAMGMEAILEFTGNRLPEENNVVALRALSFVRKPGPNGDEEALAAGAWGGRSTLALRNVPLVLLNECYNDLRAIAAEGTGFDPEWEKKAFGA
jgi:hypothetical protein